MAIVTTSHLLDPSRDATGKGTQQNKADDINLLPISRSIELMKFSAMQGAALLSAVPFFF